MTSKVLEESDEENNNNDLETINEDDEEFKGGVRKSDICLLKRNEGEKKILDVSTTLTDVSDLYSTNDCPSSSGSISLRGSGILPVLSDRSVEID